MGYWMSFLSWIKRWWKGQQFSSFNPRPKCLKAIEDSPYNSETNACRHKAKDAYKCLKEHGYNVIKVVSGPADGWDKGYHGWIEIEHEGEKYWYDPTWYSSNPIKYGCHLASEWTDRKVVTHEYSGVLEPVP